MTKVLNGLQLAGKYQPTSQDLHTGFTNMPIEKNALTYLIDLTVECPAWTFLTSLDPVAIWDATPPGQHMIGYSYRCSPMPNKQPCPNELKTLLWLSFLFDKRE
jgi:hypothetical protein